MDQQDLLAAAREVQQQPECWPRDILLVGMLRRKLAELNLRGKQVFVLETAVASVLLELGAAAMTEECQALTVELQGVDYVLCPLSNRRAGTSEMMGSHAHGLVMDLPNQRAWRFDSFGAGGNTREVAEGVIYATSRCLFDDPMAITTEPLVVPFQDDSYSCGYRVDMTLLEVLDCLLATGRPPSYQYLEPRVTLEKAIEFRDELVAHILRVGGQGEMVWRLAGAWLLPALTVIVSGLGGLVSPTTHRGNRRSSSLESQPSLLLLLLLLVPSALLRTLHPGRQTTR